MYDNQKNMMENFKNFVPKAPTSYSPADLMKQYENFMKQQEQYFGNASKYWESMPKFGGDPVEMWQKTMAQFNPMELSKQFGLEESQVFEKIIDANKFYLSLYNFYDDIKKHYVAPAVGELEDLSKQAVENFDKMFTESMLPLLPDEFRPFLENPYNLTKTVVDVTTKFFEPWKESMPQMTEALLQAPLSREQLSEYVKLWKENYETTVGALMKSPAAGMNRDFIEQQNKAVDASTEMLLTMIEFVGQISNVTSQQGKLSVEDFIQELQNSAEPKSFREFYNYWTKKIEDELVKYFYTDEYAQMLGKVVEAGAKYKIESDKLSEKYLSNTVIVTKGQIDSLYKTVYELRREVRALKRELTEDAPKADEKESK